VTRQRVAFVKILAFNSQGRFNRTENLPIANREQNMRLDFPIEQ